MGSIVRGKVWSKPFLSGLEEHSLMFRGWYVNIAACYTTRQVDRSSCGLLLHRLVTKMVLRQRELAYNLSKSCCSGTNLIARDYRATEKDIQWTGEEGVRNEYGKLLFHPPPMAQSEAEKMLSLDARGGRIV